MNVFRVFKVVPLAALCALAGLSGCNNTNDTSYSLTGTISVTSGGDITGLVLSDGIASTVSLTSGQSTFSFNNNTPYLFTNTNYTITVQKQPANLRCNVTNGKGAPNGNNVTNVSVSCLKPTASSVLASLGAGAKITGMVTDTKNVTYVVNNGALQLIPAAGTPVTTVPLVDSNGTAITTPNLSSLTINSTGTLLYASSGFTVVKITIPTSGEATAYTMTLLAGSGTQGTTNAQGALASFSAIQGLAVDINGIVYVRDAGAFAIRRIDGNGNVSILAGSGVKGHIDSTGASAAFDFADTAPTVTTSGLSIDSNNYLYAVEGGNNNDIRIINISGVVNTLAGSATTAGHADGAGTAATFTNPYTINVDTNSNIYVVDGDNSLRLITTAGNVTTLLSAAPSPTFVALSQSTANDLYMTTNNATGDIQKVSFQ